METLSSNLGTSIAVLRPRALRLQLDNRVPSFSLSYQRQHFGKVYLAEKLVLQNTGNDTRGFVCRNSAQEAEGSLESKGGQNSERPIERKRLAVFVSGGGSNLRSIHEATLGGLVHGDVVVLVTDKPGCGGAEYAINSDIPVVVFPKTKSSPEGLSSVDLVTTLRNFKVDFILLAGYLKLIPTELVQAYPRSMLNIHPSLLPAFGGKGFYGLKVHQAVIASGARRTIQCKKGLRQGDLLALIIFTVIADVLTEMISRAKSTNLLKGVAARDTGPWQFLYSRALDRIHTSCRFAVCSRICNEAWYTNSSPPELASLLSNSVTFVWAKYLLTTSTRHSAPAQDITGDGNVWMVQVQVSLAPIALPSV